MNIERRVGREGGREEEWKKGRCTDHRIMRKREGVSKMERGMDGKSAKLMARWLDCKGKMEAKKRETDQGQSDRKEDGKREGRAQKTEGRMGPREEGKSGRQQKERKRR